MHVTAIIAAGGRGRRFGTAGPKQLIEIGGRAVLARSVALFVDHPEVHDIIVAMPPDLMDAPPSYLGRTGKPVQIVAGGARRQDSVANAFRLVSEQADVIVVHDAARPFASAHLVSQVIAAAAESGAALAAIQARDTVKQVGRAATSGAPAERGPEVVIATLSRESIYLAQTPQAFRRDVLRDAFALGREATDEAALAEQAGHVVRIVEGEVSNIKITTPEDLTMAEALAGRVDEARGRQRVGVGLDLHRLVENRPLILGGVAIPFDRGLTGHSDADAVCHAIIEAILGAAAAGDIGRHFPDNDPAWKGASSLDLLRRAAAIVREHGLDVGNVDATVVAERPKLAPYIEAMRSNLASALSIDLDRVSVKGKTHEGVGELGRGEAIAVHAVALLTPITTRRVVSPERAASATPQRSADTHSAPSPPRLG